MKKGIISIIVLVIGIGIGAGVASQVIEKPEISTTLSERSKEYLAAKKSGSTLGTAYISEDKKTLPVGQNVNIDDCFSLSIPFEVAMQRRDSQCNYYFQIQSPRGSIFAYQKTAPSSTWDNVPGVSMRRRTPWTYTEKDISVNGHDFLTFTSNTDGTYQYNAFYRTADSYMVINLAVSTNENLQGKFTDMLKSVKIK